MHAWNRAFCISAAFPYNMSPAWGLLERQSEREASDTASGKSKLNFVSVERDGSTKGEWKRKRKDECLNEFAPGDQGYSFLDGRSHLLISSRHQHFLCFLMEISIIVDFSFSRHWHKVNWKAISSIEILKKASRVFYLLTPLIVPEKKSKSHLRSVKALEREKSGWIALSLSLWNGSWHRSLVIVSPCKRTEWERRRTTAALTPLLQYRSSCRTSKKIERAFLGRSIGNQACAHARVDF